MTATPPPNPYAPDQQSHILAIARNVVTATLSYQTPAIPPLTDQPPFLQERRGCFVTLHTREHRLRGCIGTFDPTHPLIEALHRMGIAVTRDPRFIFANPVTLAELNDILVEVSILTPLQQMTRPEDLRLGIDGIHVAAVVNGRPLTGCFLPQVPVEQGWDIAQTLSYCCAHKMGIPEDAWRTDTSLRFSRFQSIIIQEAAPGVLKQ